MQRSMICWRAAPPSPSQRAAWQQVVGWLLGESHVDGSSKLCRPQPGAEGGSMEQRCSNNTADIEDDHNDTPAD
jgi:hypothetical protein